MSAPAAPHADVAGLPLGRAGTRDEDEERTRTLAFARLAVAAFAGASLVLFVAAIPARFDELTSLARGARATYAASHGGAAPPGSFPDPTGYALGVLFLEILMVLSLTVVSGAIVWRRTWTRSALLFAAVFVGYGVWVTPTLDAFHLPGPWWLATSIVQAAGQLLAVVFFLTFPDGRFVPSWARMVAAAWCAYAIAWALWPTSSFSLIDPFGATAAAAAALMFGGWGVGLLAQLARYRGYADEEQRRQTKVVMIVILAACVGYAAVYTPGVFLHTGTARLLYDLYAVPAFWLFGLPIPIALTVAMLRHRLFGVSVVFVRAIVFGILAAFITLAYVAIVIGVGSVVGGSARPNLALSLLATAAVAVAFQPVRARAQRFANRVVYGRRASPYEVLAEFAQQVGDTYAIEDLLPVTARILAEGTGSDSANVWLRVGEELHVLAAWPWGSEPHAGALALANGELASLPDVSLFLPVRDRDELLGALSLCKPPDEVLTAAEEALARNLASQAGLVLRNVRLTEELRGHVRELRASRQRIVAAQDQERRRLERNIHDGAQQQLVAIAVKAGLVKAMMRRDGPAAEHALEELQAEVQDAVATLRDLARGIYPPLLSDEGLSAALTAQARKAPLPVEVHAEGVGRYAQEAEAAVYFCVLEALQNATRYSKATAARVELSAEDGRLGFRVTDDGVGFDRATAGGGSGLQNMSDRMAALGGRLEVRSQPGRGTTVQGSIPVSALGG